MKPLNLVVAASVVLGAMSCNNNEKKADTVSSADTSVSVKTVAQVAATEGTAVTVSTAEVPDTIRNSFTAKYPKAITAQWVKYTPVETDYLPMDNQYYYVVFTNNGEDITSWYNNKGEWVKTSTKIKGDPRLPDAVNKTLNAQYPGYAIEEVSRENDKDMEMYEIKLRKGEEKAKLKILPNGEVFKRK
jgi:hypothetical protein